MPVSKLVDAMGFRAWTGPVPGMRGAHQHHDLELNLVLTGWVEYLMGGRRLRLPADAMALFWAARPHQLVASDAGARMGWVVLPLAWLQEPHMPSELTAELLAGSVLMTPQSGPRAHDDLVRWEQLLARPDRRWHRIAELEVQACLQGLALQGEVVRLAAPQRSGARVARRPAMGEMPAASAHDRSSMPEAVERITAYLSEHYREPLTIADIAEHVHLHPNYAMRLFRRELGVSIGTFLTRQRVFESQRLLMTTDLPILTIAYEAGFGSASQFHEVFRRLVGTTPRAFRLSQKGQAVADPRRRRRGDRP